MVNVTKSPFTNGNYTIAFGRDLTGCSAAATIGNNGPASVTPNEATAGASIQTLGQNSVVQVQTEDLAGNNQDNNFHLIVTC